VGRAFPREEVRLQAQIIKLRLQQGRRRRGAGRSQGERTLSGLFRQEDGVDYYEGEDGLEEDLTTRDLQFWFEFASTYSYVSVARIEDMGAAAGVPIAWEPFLLGPIFAEQGWDDSPFNLYPAKGRYMWRDVERLCAKHGIPFAKPSRFPRSGLLAARVACLARATGEPWLPGFVRAVFRANFAEDRDIGDAAEVGAILDALGLPGALIVERAHAPDNKGRLREQTGRATSIGIFGAPSFVVGDELFWGDDRLEDALSWAVDERRKT
jgi:2-hydroxychromene-2-carboxylate isomerase